MALAAVLALAAAYGQFPAQPASAEEPDEPLRLTATAVSPIRIELRWEAPEDDGGSPVTGYKIERRALPGTEYTVVRRDTGNNGTTYEDRNLKTGTAYAYRVYAINDDGTGERSVEASATPTASSKPLKRVPPPAPSSLAASDVSPTEVKLAWEAPDAEGILAVTGYKIEQKKAGKEYSVKVKDTGSAAASHTVSGLKTGQAYVFRVYAMNPAGTSPASPEAGATPTAESVKKPDRRAPGAPRSPEAAALSPGSIIVTWEPPAPNGGPSPWSYEVHARRNSGEFERAGTVDAPATSYVAKGLDGNSRYAYRVAAVNEEGPGPLSSQAGPVRPEHTDAPTRLAAAEVSPTSARLEWFPPSQTYGMKIRGYEVLEMVADRGIKAGRTSGEGATSHLLTGLKTGKEHAYAVKALFPIGASPESDVVEFTLTRDSGGATAKPPGKPIGLAAEAASATAVNLTWAEPASDGGSPVTGYKVEAKRSGERSYGVVVADTGSARRAYSHADASPGTEYEYRVYAINPAGTGPASETSKATTKKAGTGAAEPPDGGAKAADGAGAEPPSPPRDLRAERTARETALLTWGAPASDGGSPVTGYKVEARKDPGSYATIATNAADATSYLHGGLDGDSSYTYKVYAVNAAGESRQSIPATARTMGPAAAGPAEPAEAGAEAGADPAALVPGFPDPGVDPATYVERYENEIPFREWFDATFPGMTVREVVGAPQAGGGRGDPAALAGFPDPSVDPATYVERYENEIPFREWFDATYPGMTIQEVVGAPQAGGGQGDPAALAGFPDPSVDPATYVERYENEIPFREWFDATYPGMTIQEVVGAPQAGGGQGDPAALAGFPDPGVDPGIYAELYGTDAGFKEWFDATYPGMTIQEVVGAPQAGGGGLVDRAAVLAKFPDPDVDPAVYVELYGTEIEFKEWFDASYPGRTIREVVGAPAAAPPAPPEESSLARYYQDRYDAEPPYKEWFDARFGGKAVAEAIPESASFGECGRGTELKDGICQIPLE